jgi:hypothetical protein
MVASVRSNYKIWKEVFFCSSCRSERNCGGSFFLVPSLWWHHRWEEKVTTECQSYQSFLVNGTITSVDVNLVDLSSGCFVFWDSKFGSKFWELVVDERTQNDGHGIWASIRNKWHRDLAITATFRPSGLFVLVFNEIWEMRMLAPSNFVLQEISYLGLHVYILK